MSMLKFFRFPFAIAGDKTPIPDPSQVTGAVSYSTGFGPDYELDPLVDPDGKDVPRDETNQLFYDVTNALREYQTFGTPDFITSAQNGGAPFSYDKNARVVWSDGEVYESRVNSNTDLPTVTASWRKVSGTNDQTLLIAVAGGTANALTASFSPSLTGLTNGVPFFIRCAAPNTTTTPTLNVDGLGAKTICKGANVALVAGDLPGSGFWAVLQYDATLDKFVLANPARGVVPSVLTKFYDSGEQTITPAGALTLSHGLGEVPKVLNLYLVCKTAEGGYSPGDVVSIRTGSDYNDIIGNNMGVQLSVSSTDIYGRYGITSSCFPVLNKSSGAKFFITNSSWRLVIQAIA